MTKGKSAVKLQRRPLRPDQFQSKGIAEEQKGLAVGVLPCGNMWNAFQFFTRTIDPIHFLLYELFDQDFRSTHRRANGE